MTDVFISYSRADSEFVLWLNNTLKRRGHDTWVDWQDIPRGDEWLNEIYDGIDNADTFISVISHHSLTSQICNDEIAYALSRNKRVMPLILERIEGTVFNEVAGRWITVPWEQRARSNWEEIRSLNWLFFTESEKYDQEIGALIEALETDQAHVKAHTRYLTRALEWDRAGRKPSMLLNGDELTAAEQWLKDTVAEKRVPPADSLHRIYIEESRAEETRQQERAAAQERRTHRLRVAAGTLAVVVVIAFGATVLALASAAESRSASNAAQTQIGIAHDERAQSEALRVTAEAQATRFAFEQEHAQLMLQRFGIVPTLATTLEPAALVARATAEANPTPQPSVVQRIKGADMVQVPPGCFNMGSVIDSAAPVHQICFDEPYWIDRLEVTRRQYEVCVLAGACSDVEANVYSTGNNDPVNNVVWTQALAYCQWRGARLPTEPEWEYAARGPDSRVYPWGDTFNPDYLVYIGNSNFKTAPVGTRPPESASWVGAMDMAGNVWEWVSTAYSSEDFTTIYRYPYTPDDGREDLTRTDVRRVTRGGSFNDDENNPRSAQRAWLHPTDMTSGHLLVGFRCAASESELATPAAAG
ncbi:MAG TPA: SUMF1/EgtB/PvdO family nonheme iron enzyme [Aggregatilinea sp.]|uniref:SUMF1/EgtB/PvdO family nonheme iron enzyme n=1 Tax=Aggregatilinea sp. TaxID=2806333 RepID=UPI002C246E48|nr:SUMF1/EgtB/PvdO family nonheme iron enzyme [Aggregatilinea sp.]HML20864.1 SUMF1/EgtB/PvdO family nonheme iron enzyme [Aggregatilinea sp.]